jgi:glyceraldehyde 3-phosphate dehydrogenase
VTARVAIHGFGRTGRQAFKAIWQYYRDRLEIAAIGLEDPEDASAAAHLLKYDSNYGRFGPAVRVEGDALHVDGSRIPIVAADALAQLPWQTLGVDIVIESTGAYVDGRQAAGHLEAGANKVIITAPTDDADFTLIYGVNEAGYDPAAHHVVCTSSDTGNCLAAVAKVLDEHFDVVSAMMTAVRAYTNTQKLLDATDRDLRCARSAPDSIVPTPSRAVASLGRVLPDFAARLGGYAVRVPVPTVSILELTAQLAGTPTADEVNHAYRRAAAGPLGHVLAVADDPLVSTDYRGNTKSAVVDLPLTLTIGPLVKVSAWYDNEWGYSCRVADAAAFMAEQAEHERPGRNGKE